MSKLFDELFDKAMQDIAKIEQILDNCCLSTEACSEAKELLD